MSEEPQTHTPKTRKQIDALLDQADRVQGNTAKLQKLAGEARELARVAGYAYGQARGELLLSGYYESLGSRPDALEACFNALALARDSGDVAMQAQVLHALGKLYRHGGDEAEALTYADQALELLCTHDALLRLGLNELFFRLQLLRSDALMRLDRHGEALAGYLEALPTAQEAGDETLERLYLALGECHVMTGNLSAALEANRKARDVALDHNLGPAELTVIETQHGAICECGADATGALAAYKDALNHAIRSNNKYAVSSTLACIGRLQLSMRQVDAAKTTLNRALAIAWEIDSDDLAREIHERLALWYDERDYLVSGTAVSPTPVREDDTLPLRLRHLREIPKPSAHRDDKEIFRQINEEIKDYADKIRDLRRDLDKHVRDMELTANLAHALTGAADAEQCVKVLAAGLAQTQSFDALAVGTCKDEQKFVDYRYIYVAGGAVPAERRSHPADILKAILTGRDVSLGNIRPTEAQRYAVATVDEAALPRSALFCPFVAGGETHVLALHSQERNAFDAANLQLLRTVAQMLGLAVGVQARTDAVVRQETALRQVMRTDALTGLLSRHDIIGRIEEEDVRVQRSKRPFSLVLIEADQLRDLRDSCGQECFDALMQQLSRLLRPSIRKQDFLARWSDDQFALLLPETDADGAAKLCEKLRRKAAKQAFEWQEQEIRLTLSCGLTEHHDGRRLDALQKAAESALLAAKLKGRDCVEKR